jgi:hypothetical protein
MPWRIHEFARETRSGPAARAPESGRDRGGFSSDQRGRFYGRPDDRPRSQGPGHLRPGAMRAQGHRRGGRSDQAGRQARAHSCISRHFENSSRVQIWKSEGRDSSPRGGRSAPGQDVHGRRGVLTRGRRADGAGFPDRGLQGGDRGRRDHVEYPGHSGMGGPRPVRRVNRGPLRNGPRVSVWQGGDQRALPQ